MLSWSEMGFAGSLLLVVYGLFYFIVYLLPPVLFSPMATTAILVILGLLALMGGVLLSLGMIYLWSEFGSKWALLSLVLGVASWASQSVAHLLLALGQYLAGVALYGVVIPLMMVTFLAWGGTLLTVRKHRGAQERFTFYAGILFMFTALAWIGYMGLAILAFTALITLFTFTPPHRLVTLLRIGPETRFLLARLGSLLLAIYALLAVRWTIDDFIALPIPAAAPLNALSLICIWMALPGVSLILHHYEVHHHSRLASLALIIGIPSWALLSLADLYWLISNMIAPADPGLALIYYYATSLFWSWSALPLLLWSGLTSLAFLSVWYELEAGEEVTPWHLFIGLLLLASSPLWLFGLGLYPLIPAFLILLIIITHEPEKW